MSDINGLRNLRGEIETETLKETYEEDRRREELPGLKWEIQIVAARECANTEIEMKREMRGENCCDEKGIPSVCALPRGARGIGEERNQEKGDEVEEKGTGESEKANDKENAPEN